MEDPPHRGVGDGESSISFLFLLRSFCFFLVWFGGPGVWRGATEVERRAVFTPNVLYFYKLLRHTSRNCHPRQQSAAAFPRLAEAGFRWPEHRTTESLRTAATWHHHSWFLEQNDLTGKSNRLFPSMLTVGPPTWVVCCASTTNSDHWWGSRLGVPAIPNCHRTAARVSSSDLSRGRRARGQLRRGHWHWHST